MILDVVLNHAGDVFATTRPFRRAVGPAASKPVDGWRTTGRRRRRSGSHRSTAAWPDGAVSRPSCTPESVHPPRPDRRLGPLPEYVEGDFGGPQGHRGTAAAPSTDYRPSPALEALTRAYCWWIGHADLDGFRVDTVKHMEPGATRYFASVVHEFAQSIGKDRFLLVGEIAGSRARRRSRRWS